MVFNHLVGMIVALVGQSGADEGPSILRPGEVLVRRLEERELVVRTDALDDLTDFDVFRREFRAELTGEGPWHVEVRSHFFDAYLVLRDLDGVPLLEDDDGWIGSHASIDIPVNFTGSYALDVCSLDGGVGEFDVTLRRGKSATLSTLEWTVQTIADARRGVAAHEREYGEFHASTAESLSYLGMMLLENGELEEARASLERALTIDEEAFGSEHPNTAADLMNLGSVHKDQGELSLAKPLFERALTINEEQRGPATYATAAALNNLGSLLKELGDFEGAMPLLSRSLRIREELFGPNHPKTATGLNNLGLLLKELADFEEASVLFERALRVREALDPVDPEIATVLNNLGLALHELSEFDRAGTAFERALTIREATLGPDHPRTATSLDNLAMLWLSLGDIGAARPLLERALRVREAALGPDHTLTATSLNNLASVIVDVGDYESAVSLLRRSLRIRERLHGPWHPKTSSGLGNLAMALVDQGDPGAARPLLERSLRIEEAAFGADHPRTAEALINLASAQHDLGELEEARSNLARALAINEAAFGSEHPATATCLNSLAFVLLEQGKLEEARPYVERTQQALSSTLGSAHPWTMLSQGTLALLESDLGKTDSAWRRSMDALASSEAYLARELWSLSETERLRFVETHRQHREILLSVSQFGARAGRESRLAACYEAILQGKGRVARSLLRDGRREGRSLSVEARGIVRDLVSTQTRLSDALYAIEIEDPDEHSMTLASLRSERNRLEVELARLRREEGRAVARPVRLDDVIAALPENGAAIDFLVHSWYEPARWDGGVLAEPGGWTDDHLSAWVLRADAPLQFFDLGLAHVVEDSIVLFLEEVIGAKPSLGRGVSVAVASPVDSVPSEPAGPNDRLRRILWDPVSNAIGDAETVFVSGDSFLGALPFEAIQLPDRSYLIERYAFAYLSDLLSLPSALSRVVTSEPRLYAAGDIDYGDRLELAGEEEASSPAFTGQRASFSRSWARLDGTRAEVNAIAAIHYAHTGDAGHRLVASGPSATEELLKKSLSSFTHVHLATHGYFHPEGLPSAWKAVRERARDDGGRRRLREAENEVIGYLPGLLSGLVLAGASGAPEHGRDNGLLTAEEVTYLDMGNCDLVVLSACETGLGRAEAGEGMIGLRRAFRMAGARTVISSLWKVPDLETRDLMTGFYENLWDRRLPKLQALREAQLALLRRNRQQFGTALPSTWAAFVLDGAPE